MAPSLIKEGSSHTVMLQDKRGPAGSLAQRTDERRNSRLHRLKNTRLAHTFVCVSVSVHDTHKYVLDSRLENGNYFSLPVI